MVKAEQIVELILDAARESRVLTGGIYKDEPIIRTGKQAFGGRSTPAQRPARPAPQARQPQVQQRHVQERQGFWDLAVGLGELVSEVTTPTPEPIARMRSLARGRSPWASSYTDPKLFFEQAKLMEHYTDDYPYAGSFEKYYPTYEDMSTAQLRGYFTWRTGFRAGEVPDAPLSFLFVHAYELLCGIGAASPEAAFSQLVRLRDAYGIRPGNGALTTYLTAWLDDLTIYRGLDRTPLGIAAGGAPVERAIAVIDGAEKALLASKTPGSWSASAAKLPNAEDFTFALTAASRYRLERSRLFSERFDELAECCCAVFARMVDHCHRRRKRGFTEGLFGGEETVPYAMFRSAVFYDPAPHPDATVTLESGVEYTCRYNRWARYTPHRVAETSAELGDILHETDRVLREQLGGFPELKAREVPKYVRAIVAEEVAACLERRAAEEAARVVIDRTALRGIRAAAVRTREALLVDEEREDAPDPADAPEPLEAAVPPASAGSQEQPAQDGCPALSAADRAFLQALLAGEEPQVDGMVSLTVDRINEALFDMIGDTVIEFEGDVPRVIKDYADDVREVLG